MENLDVAQIIEIISLTGFILAQVTAIAGTPTWLPKYIRALIIVLAGNYRRAKNIQD